MHMFCMYCKVYILSLTSDRCLANPIFIKGFLISISIENIQDAL